MLRRIMVFALLALVPLAGVARDWVAYESDNFTIFSDSREQNVLALLDEFEQFRTTVLRLLNLSDEPERSRPTIILYGQNRDYDRIRPASRAAGFYYSSFAGPRMIVMSGGNLSTVREILFHEYVHFLAYQSTRENYPAWFHEGFAMVLSSIVFGRSTVQIGTSNAYRDAARTNERARVRDILTTRHASEWSTYLTSWLMTHYLLLGDESRRVLTAEYLRRFSVGQDSVEAFVQVFGMSPDEMDLELDWYLQRRRMNVLEGQRIGYDGGISTRALDPAESALLLATVAEELGRYDVAHAYLDEAISFGEQSPFWSHVLARKAITHMHERNFEDGDRLIATVIASDPQAPDLIGDVAHYANDRFVHVSVGRIPGLPDDELRQALTWGERAVEANPDNVEALVYLGMSYEAAGQLDRAANLMFRAWNIHSSPGYIDLQLARVLIKGGQPEAAATVLSRLISTSHSAESRAEVIDTVEALVSGDFDFRRFPYLMAAWEPED
jgi:tetratricopeptide (TPR) repeat protein